MNGSQLFVKNWKESESTVGGKTRLQKHIIGFGIKNDLSRDQKRFIKQQL